MVVGGVITVWFGKAMEDLGEYHDAMSAYEEANSLAFLPPPLALPALDGLVSQ